ncbi:hypothetical protein [Spirillospora sp. NPDC047279]|uniref:hypothetical protein n=1 Tax=Spirillospora sp. NPDC047279 TaxID=3155478 RepID=UPI00340EDB47
MLVERFGEPGLGPPGRWGWKTGAYPGCVSNPRDHKLDRLSARALATSSGVMTITARPQGDGGWRTGLLTTGDSCGSGGSGFEVRTGDVLGARVRLPDVGTGAWPGIWTWREGGNEIDLFEWHADRPDTLEFVNHVRGTGTFWTSPLVDRGAWLDIAVRIGASRLTWYAGRPARPLAAVHHEDRGVGPGFRAHLVASLSVDDGRLHREPAPGESFSFQIASIQVSRPSGARPLGHSTGGTR